MSIKTVEGNWWADPLDSKEKTWTMVALAWCLLITFFMPIWHFTAKQNVSSQSYKITGEQFDQLTAAFIQKYKTGEDSGVPVVTPPANSDIFYKGSQFSWEPVLKLKVNQTYRLHLSSTDVQHGFSVTPVNMNFQVVPGYDHILNLTPTTAGEFIVICNEFCGAGHHTMTGKIIVES